MRNLWQLLVRNHVFILFLVLQAFALAWVTRSHGHPRGMWVRWSLGWTGAWNAQLTEWARLGQLETDNMRLAQENADLRAQLLHKDAHGQAAEVVQITWHRTANSFILNRGASDGIAPGQAVVCAAGALGRVVEVHDHFALGLPLLHTELEWSGRIGKDGVIGRVVWDGDAHDVGRMLDIARSAQIAMGDTVFTTGYQGVFPADIPMGFVQRVTQNPSDEFLTVHLRWAVDFRSIRYVEILALPEMPSFTPPTGDV